MAENQDVKSAAAVITIAGIGTFKVPTGLNLREALRREGIYLDGTCADRGTCGRCIVRLTGGEVRPPTGMERGILDRQGAGPEERLACRLTVNGDMEISVSHERILEIEKTGRWKAVWDSPLWTANRYPFAGTGCGVALDIGTTAIAAALYDLDSGRPLDIKSAANPQIPWGDEIVSRLASAQDQDTANNLRDMVWLEVAGIIRTMCLRSGISPGSVSRMVAVGNSAVHHLVLGLPTASLLRPPYEPADAAARDMGAAGPPFGLKLGSAARIYFPPLAGGYAGSDALVSVAASISQGIKNGALIDVGTNTEIAVWDGARCLIATAPSGPAFEGGHMKSGMQAVEGAIWKAEILQNSVNFEVLGGGMPKGICGTGIVDVVAGMLDSGIVEASGLMRQGSHPMLSENGFSLDPEGNVLVEPGDIANVQKAKGAIAAALKVLLGRINLRPEELGRIYLAGAFGSRLDIRNAMSIGLLPRLPRERYVPAGNTALVGASLVLLSERAREEVQSLAGTIHHVSVAEDGQFEELFLDNLYFPQTN